MTAAAGPGVTFAPIDHRGRVARVVEGWDPSASGAFEAQLLRLLAATAP